MTDEQLSGWDRIECDLGDGLVRHFEEFAKSSVSPDVSGYIEIRQEALRVWNVMFADDQAEENSAVDDVLFGVAVGGWHSAMAHVAKALGVRVQDLEYAIGVMEHEGLPASAENLMRGCAEAVQFEHDLKAGKFD